MKLHRNNKKKISILLLLIPFIVLAADATLNSSGDWDDTGNWDGSNVGDGLESVDFNNNIGTVTIRTGFSYTIGDLAMGNGNTLVVNGSLDVGDNSNANNLSVGNTGTITVASGATLTIWGNLNPGNDLTLNINGTLIVKGDIDAGNNSTLSISGNVQVDGDFNAGNGADVTVSGGATLDVGGTFDVGNGSTMQGSGTVTGGTCTGPAAFCVNSPLPVELIYFTVENQEEITLSWATATEINNDYFSIQRSEDGAYFYEVGRIQGNGNTSEAIEYQYADKFPLADVEYYRLKQVDFDGQFEIFETIRVETEIAEISQSMTVYPTIVANDYFTVKSTTPFQIRELTLLSLDGKVNRNLTLSSSQENPLTYRTNVSGLPYGTYVVRIITSEGSSHTSRINIK